MEAKNTRKLWSHCMPKRSVLSGIEDSSFDRFAPQIFLGAEVAGKTGTVSMSIHMEIMEMFDRCTFPSRSTNIRSDVKPCASDLFL